MNGSKTNTLTREQVLALVRAVPPEKDFVWDGIDEDERPLTREEILAGHEAYKARMAAKGRPSKAEHERKESTTIRFDREVLDAFRAAGPGWQTRMNAALKDWLKTHSPI